MASEGDSRKLSDLRVIDLKAELDKRGLDKSGVKAMLMDRLQKALREEGFDPDDYQFESTDKKPSKRPSISTRLDESGEGENVDSTVEQSIQDGETDPEPVEADQSISIEEDSQVKVIATEKNSEPLAVETKVNTAAAVSENVTKEELQNQKSKTPQVDPEVEEKSATKLALNPVKVTEVICVEENESTGKKDTSKAENVPVQDPESPINLTLEEEEENMVLHDDTESVEIVDNDKQDEKTGSGNDTTTTPAQSEKEDKAAESQENAQKTSSSVDGKTTSNESSTKTNGQSEKDPKENFSITSTGRNLWVTNITQNTRATELKQVLSQFGRVIGAKVVTNARYPGARCYGYVTMETAADANNCITKLNNTELNGQIICVEKVKPDQPAALLFGLKRFDFKERQKSRHRNTSPTKQGPKENKQAEKPAEKVDDKESSPRKSDKRDSSASKDTEKREDKEGKDSDGTEKRMSKDKSSRHSRDKDRSVREKRSNSGSRKDSRSKDVPRRKGDILTFDKIREERERQKFRERERILREEERRRREESARQREIEHRQRQESIRLEREREKLRAEREKIEREKLELMRLERERQKQERERLEQEKLELQRAKMRLEEAKRRPATKRPASYRREASYEDRKRIATERHFEEPPPPPRFDTPSSAKPSSRDEAPPMKKPFGGSKDYGKPPSGQRNPFEKRDTSSYLKHDREFEPNEGRAHQAPVVRGFGGPSVKYDSNSMSMLNRERGDIRDPRKGQVMTTPSPRLTKEPRFADRPAERSPGHYRSVRDDRERRPVSDHKAPDIRSSREHGRYEPPTKEPTRFERNSGGNWHSGSANSKVFGGPGSSSGSRDNWNKPDSWRPTETTSNPDRWSGGGGSRVGMTSGSSSTMFGNNSGLNMGTSCPPPPGINNYNAERFENYKSTLSGMRKY